MKKALWDVTQQFQAKNGSLLVGGKIYIYYQGRTAMADSWKDESGSVLNSNPVLLDGNARANVFADPVYSYTIAVCDYYGVELFSQDIILHDIISTAEEVIIVGTDGSVLVDTTDLPNGVQYDLSVNQNIIATKQSVDDVIDDLGDLTGIVNTNTTDITNINTALGNKKDKQSIYNASGSQTKTITSITQDDNGEIDVTYQDIDLPPQVPNIEITSDNDSIDITESTDAITNTKTIDLQIKSSSQYGQFSASNVVVGANLSKVKGTLELSNGNIKLKKGSSYHFTMRGEYIAVRANTIDVIDFIEHSSGNVIKVDVDNTVDGVQHFELSYDVYNLTQDINYSVAFNNLQGIISELTLYVHNIGAISSGGGGVPDNYDSLYSTVSSNSANWDNAYNTVDSSSPNWDNTYNTVLSNSATWNEGGSCDLYSSDGSLLISADGSAYDLKLNEQLSAKNYFVTNNENNYSPDSPAGSGGIMSAGTIWFGTNKPKTDLSAMTYDDDGGKYNTSQINIPKEMKLFDVKLTFSPSNHYNSGPTYSTHRFMLYQDNTVLEDFLINVDNMYGTVDIERNFLIYNPMSADSRLWLQCTDGLWGGPPSDWFGWVKIDINDETYRSIGTSVSGIPDNYDSLYSTVSSNSAAWNEGGTSGTSYSAGPNINITNDVISGKDWSNELNSKLDTTAFTPLALPSSANWDNTYNTVNSNSATWNNNSQIINHNLVASGTLVVNNNEYINVSALDVSGVLTVKAMNTSVTNGEPITQCGGTLSFNTQPSSINFIDSNDTALPKLDGIPTTFSGNAYQFTIINGVVACQEIK